jgi:hypothetical protein
MRPRLFGWGRLLLDPPDDAAIQATRAENAVRKQQRGPIRTWEVVAQQEQGPIGDRPRIWGRFAGGGDGSQNRRTDVSPLPRRRLGREEVSQDPGVENGEGALNSQRFVRASRSRSMPKERRVSLRTSSPRCRQVQLRRQSSVDRRQVSISPSPWSGTDIEITVDS